VVRPCVAGGGAQGGGRGRATAGGRASLRPGPPSWGSGGVWGAAPTGTRDSLTADPPYPSLPPCPSAPGSAETSRPWAGGCPTWGLVCLIIDSSVFTLIEIWLSSGVGLSNPFNSRFVSISV
jgi:hypothetical protein